MSRLPPPSTHDCSFASDNTAGICPEAWSALEEANRGCVTSYGNDEWTRRACDLIRDTFEKPDAEVYFVFNGTAANSLALASLCQSYHSVICHDYAHIETDECGAPEFFSNGTKLLVASGPNGKIQPEDVERLILKRTDIHFPKPRVLSLTQSTEWGTVYTLDEIRALTAAAKRHGLAVHMDGARFANAAAALMARGGVSPADFTWRAGVDVLCFGGTKNGMMTTEAVVFFNPKLAHEFDYRCKQAGQLASKMRLHGAQWVGMLRDGAWLRHAAHANTMAARLTSALRELPHLRFQVEPEVNALFVELPKPVADGMHRRGWHFYGFIGASGYRLMCSWATTEDTLRRFILDLKSELADFATHRPDFVAS
ncbi:Low specificity L-threonine aldolase [mine drainage metagenome]|uniref:Low specificity L-threonine aldolase n=1 Tax=mine drainage metagenome TaxID=410659 RepID=A0A1J5S3W9_9ZZZZ